MSIQKREKANDVNRKFDSFLVKRVSFKEAFSKIANIKVEVWEFEGMMRPKDDSYKKDTHSYHSSINPRYHLQTEDNFLGEFVDCSESLCYNGGINVVKIIRNMLNDNLNYKEGEVSCQGYLGSPKGRKKYKYCSHEFEYRISFNLKK